MLAIGFRILPLESLRISTQPAPQALIAQPGQRVPADLSVARRSLGERIIRMERGWFTDFAWENGGVVVRKTGATTPLNAAVLGHVATWLRYFLVVRAAGFARRLSGRRGLSIWFSPEVPRPWYMIRSAAAWAGMRVVADPAQADIAFHFDDSTWSPAAAPFAGRTINGACSDISKSHVNRLFAQVFGYRIGIAPMSWSGEAVEKSETNSMHDGRIVSCPVRPVAGRCYQRLVRTSHSGEVHDLRTACVGGRPVAVWVKTRTTADRFASGANLRVTSHAPAEMFSPAELDRIVAFNAAIGLEWGTLDILREVEDGRIYIVDVNKTDVGPVLQLPMREKIASTRALAAALRAMIAQAPAQADRLAHRPCLAPD